MTLYSSNICHYALVKFLKTQEKAPHLLVGDVGQHTSDEFKQENTEQQAHIL